MATNGNMNPVIITIFGIKGDLAMRKLMPALFNLFLDKSMPPQFQIIGVGRDCSAEYLTTEMRPHVDEFSRRGKTTDADWAKFAPNLSAVDGDFADPKTYQEIADAIQKTEKKWDVKASRVYYLSVPPTLVEGIVANLGKAHLSKDVKRDRVVVEKPFGRDLGFGREAEQEHRPVVYGIQIFRIDHYLGKETVQNISPSASPTPCSSPSGTGVTSITCRSRWPRTVGVESRGSYYDTPGALRDMIQNHLLQIMCLIAMEPPTSFDADEMRNKKVDVLQADPAHRPDQVHQFAVRGQYGHGMDGGENVSGYRQEPDVAPESSHGNLRGAASFMVDNWRWQDVPFYLRTGKRLPSKISQVSIQFKPVPHQVFPSAAVEHWEPNRLIMNIQPEEGICFGSRPRSRASTCAFAR